MLDINSDLFKVDRYALFMLEGDSLNDISSNNAVIETYGDFGENNIVDEDINGYKVKCINFNTDGYIQFDLDSSFFRGDDGWTIEWWEKDETDYTQSTYTKSSIITNETASNQYGFALNAWDNAGQRRIIHMSHNNASNYGILNGVTIEDNNNRIRGRWVHRAVVYTRDDNKYKMYQNGVNTGLYTRTSFPYAHNRWQMGRYKDNDNSILNTKICKFRISRIARYRDAFNPSINPDLLEDLEMTEVAPLGENATLYDIVNTSLQLNSNYDAIRRKLINCLIKFRIGANADYTFSDIVKTFEMLSNGDLSCGDCDITDTIRAELIEDINDIIGGL